MLFTKQIQFINTGKKPRKTTGGRCDSKWHKKVHRIDIRYQYSTISRKKKGGAGGNILRGEKAEWVKWSRLSLSTDLVLTHWHAGRARSMPSILVTPPPRPPQSPGCWMTSQTS